MGIEQIALVEGICPLCQGVGARPAYAATWRRLPNCRDSPSELHVDGGDVSDIVFATMHLLGLDFEPRIPRLSDRRLYAFGPSKHYGRLAPLFGHRLNRDLIVSHWPDIERVIGPMRDRTVTP